MVVAACHAAFTASKVRATGAAAEELPTPCPAKVPASPAKDCCKTDNKTDAEAFANILLCIAEELCAKKPCTQKPCDCPPGVLAKRDRDALLEHITDTLVKLGSLEEATDRDLVQKVLADALTSGGKKKPEVAREVLAFVASMPSKPPKKVTVITETNKVGDGCCLPGKCTTTETTEVLAEPVAPAPLSTVVVQTIVDKLCELRKCCPASKCPLPCRCPTVSCARPTGDLCKPAPCFDVRWDLVNMLIMDAEHGTERDIKKIVVDLSSIADGLPRTDELLDTKIKLLKIAKQIKDVSGIEMLPSIIASLKTTVDRLKKPNMNDHERECIAKILSDAAKKLKKLEQHEMASKLEGITAKKIKQLPDLAKQLREIAGELDQPAEKSEGIAKTLAAAETQLHALQDNEIVERIGKIVEEVKKHPTIVPALKAEADKLDVLLPYTVNNIVDALRKIDIVEELSKIADILETAQQKDFAEQLRSIIENLKRNANQDVTAQALMDELCDYEKLVKSPCGVHILLRVIDGVAEVNEPFKPETNLAPQFLFRSGG